MKPSSWSTRLPTALLAAAVTAGCQLPDARPPYPDSPREPRIERHHGLEVVDPYPWLERTETERAGAWIDEQEALLERVLSDVSERSRILERVRRLRARNPHGIPQRRGLRTFYIRSSRTEWRPTVRVRDDAGDRVLVDANAGLPEGGAPVFSGFAPSPNGSLVAYWTSVDGSAWQQIHVVDGGTGEAVGPSLTGFHLGRGNVAWAGERGFFYPRSERSETVQGGGSGPGQPGRTRLYHHQIGDAKAADALVLEDSVDGVGLSPSVTHDGAWLVVTERAGSGSRVWVGAIDHSGPPTLRPVVTEAKALYAFEGGAGRTLLFRTDLDAPGGRVLAVDLTDPERPEWSELVPETEDVLRDVSEVGEHLVLRYERYPKPLLRVHDRSGRLLREAEPPGVGGIGPIPDDPTFGEAYYGFGSLTEPGTIYRFDVDAGTSAIAFRAELPYEPSDFRLSQSRYRSADGTEVPLLIAHHVDVTPGPDTPTLLYGYGAYGFVSRPFNLPHIVAWMEMGGVYAVAGIRGGGEYGEAWHEAGTALRKQTSIDDYVAAAEFLIDGGYTDPRRLVANGGSAGGIVAGAALTQRPELFGAALLEFPVLDMLRYHELGSAGRNPAEFGTVADSAQFEVLMGYSPYHNVEAGICYPPTLVQVGERDAAASPAHGYKFVAALQEAQSCASPVLLKVARGAGHGHGATDAQRDLTTADELTFLAHVLDIPTPAGWR